MLQNPFVEKLITYMQNQQDKESQELAAWAHEEVRKAIS